MLTDPVANFLNHIKTASERNHAEIKVPASKMKLDILKTMQHAHLVEGFEVVPNGKFSSIVVKLFLNKPLALKRVSTPGRRIYREYKELRPVRSGMGVQILSTSKGVMTNRQAIKEQVGGEVICEGYVK